MSEARTFSREWGHGRYALLYDIATTIIIWLPASREDLQASQNMFPRLIYPYYLNQVVRECQN